MSTATIQSLTHKGLRRPTNQDVALSISLPEDFVLLAVADGVGGSRAGGTAAAKAIQALSEYFKTHPLSDAEATLREAFHLANEQVYRASTGRSELRGMATTLVAALIRDDIAWVASVGDSRAYLVSAREAQRLTTDHSLAEEGRAIGDAGGFLDGRYPKNVITRSIGAAETVDTDVFGPVEVPQAGAILLCSDGLHGSVEDGRLSAALKSENVAETLVQMANDAGGPDNIGVAIYRRP